VDLDAAFGRGPTRICWPTWCAGWTWRSNSRWYPDDESLRAALGTGAARVNIGTAALEDPIWCDRVLHEYGDRWRSAGTCAADPVGPRLDPRRR